VVDAGGAEEVAMESTGVQPTVKVTTNIYKYLFFI
jgi:hypothetical protein